MLGYVFGQLTLAYKFQKGIAVTDLIGASPWIIVTAIITWIGQAFIYRKDIRKMELDHTISVDQSRDTLALELLNSARNEVVQARSEMSAMREEVNSLRAMEQHFYHFQQAIDHLSAILFANDDSERSNAERNAKAFLARMKRAQQPDPTETIMTPNAEGPAN